jgi:hypothetical protein
MSNFLIINIAPSDRPACRSSLFFGGGNPLMPNSVPEQAQDNFRVKKVTFNLQIIGVIFYFLPTHQLALPIID